MLLCNNDTNYLLFTSVPCMQSQIRKGRWQIKQEEREKQAHCHWSDKQLNHKGSSSVSHALRNVPWTVPCVASGDTLTGTEEVDSITSWLLVCCSPPVRSLIVSLNVSQPISGNLQPCWLIDSVKKNTLQIRNIHFQYLIFFLFSLVIMGF